MESKAILYVHRGATPCFPVTYPSVVKNKIISVSSDHVKSTVWRDVQVCWLERPSHCSWNPSWIYLAVQLKVSFHTNMKRNVCSIAPNDSHQSAAQQSSRYCRLKSSCHLPSKCDCESNQIYELGCVTHS